MKKTDLLADLAKEIGISRRLSLEIINTLLNEVIRGVKQTGVLNIHGFGKFKTSNRKAREGASPQDPAKKIKIPAMKVVTFKAGADFKKAVKN